MSQKGNFQTIRPFLRNINLIHLVDTKVSKSLNFLRYIEKFFNKKLMIPISLTFNIIGKKMVISLILFARTAKILRINRNARISKKNLEQNFTNFFFDFILKNLKFLDINLVSLKVVLINKVFSKRKKDRFLQTLFLKNRFFKDTLFIRRQNLFFDYLKISFLLLKNLATPKVFIEFLGDIFKFLPKHKHAKFLIFLTRTFKMFIDLSSDENNCSIKGIRFLVCGRLKGKLRKSKSLIQIGKVPVQSISKNVDYVKKDVFTKNGVFGFKLWVFKD